MSSGETIQLKRRLSSVIGQEESFLEIIEGLADHTTAGLAAMQVIAASLGSFSFESMTAVGEARLVALNRASQLKAVGLTAITAVDATKTDLTEAVGKSPNSNAQAGVRSVARQYEIVSDIPGDAEAAELGLNGLTLGTISEATVSPILAAFHGAGQRVLESQRLAILVMDNVGIYHDSL